MKLRNTGRLITSCSRVAMVLAAIISATVVQAEVRRTAAEVPPPAWPAIQKPAKSAPSVLLIMTDDVGFGASSTFGGPVPTPAFDALAAQGLRYNQFHTAGICSPTRAALLTGRNPSAVGMGNVADAATSYEGYTSVMPKSAATVAAHLQHAGYVTAMFGKHHATPSWEQGPAGPFDRWPTGLGFNYFYGFHGGDTNQFAPVLFENTRVVDIPERDVNYILDHDLADRAISWINEQKAAAPSKPFFVYYAPGTSHAPHHAPKDWIARFKGRFDHGWDKVREEILERQKALGIIPKDARLTPRPKEIPAWTSLTAQQKRVYARQMEVYAAALSHADYQIGRVIEAAHRQASGNLLVIYIQGDNGASAEAGLDGSLNEHGTLEGNKADLSLIDKKRDELGGPMTLSHYSIGWAHAMNTPFPWVKQLASHFGATRNGMVIAWPDHIKDIGQIRGQFHYITDITPTILEAANITPDEKVSGVVQQPFDGVSMSYSFTQPESPSRRRTQHFNVWDNLAIYHDGWVAGTYPESFPWNVTTPNPAKIKGRRWELYNLRADFSQSIDLAVKHPDKLHELQGLFWGEAARAQALPIHRYEGAQGRPSLIAGLSSFTLPAGIPALPEGAAPRLLNRSFDIAARVTIPAEGAQGVLIAQGGRFGGYSFYVKDGRLTFHYNVSGLERFVVDAPAAMPAGDHVLGARFDYEGGRGGGGMLTLSIDGKAVGSGRIARTLAQRVSLDETMDVGLDRWTPVTEDYTSPFPFKGTLRHVEINLR